MLVSRESVSVQTLYPTKVLCLRLKTEIPCGIHIQKDQAYACSPMSRARWIMETLEHLECTVGLVARLCRSWLSPGNATRIPRGRNPNWTIQYNCQKKKKYRVRFQIDRVSSYPLLYLSLGCSVYTELMTLRTENKKKSCLSKSFDLFSHCDQPLSTG